MIFSTYNNDCTCNFKTSDSTLKLLTYMPYSDTSKYLSYLFEKEAENPNQQNVLDDMPIITGNKYNIIVAEKAQEDEVRNLHSCKLNFK